MVTIRPSRAFIKAVKHLGGVDRESLEKQIKKIISKPAIGKLLTPSPESVGGGAFGT